MNQRVLDAVAASPARHIDVHHDQRTPDAMEARFSKWLDGWQGHRQAPIAAGRDSSQVLARTAQSAKRELCRFLAAVSAGALGGPLATGLHGAGGTGARGPAAGSTLVTGVLLNEKLPKCVASWASEALRVGMKASSCRKQLDALQR